MMSTSSLTVRALLFVSLLLLVSAQDEASPLSTCLEACSKQYPGNRPSVPGAQCRSSCYNKYPTSTAASVVSEDDIAASPGNTAPSPVPIPASPAVPSTPASDALVSLTKTSVAIVLTTSMMFFFF